MQGRKRSLFHNNRVDRPTGQDLLLLCLSSGWCWFPTTVACHAYLSPLKETTSNPGLCLMSVVMMETWPSFIAAPSQSKHAGLAWRLWSYQFSDKHSKNAHWHTSTKRQTSAMRDSKSSFSHRCSHIGSERGSRLLADKFLEALLSELSRELYSLQGFLFGFAPPWGTSGNFEEMWTGQGSLHYRGIESHHKIT